MVGVIIYIFYVLAGILLAIPYCLLAGWSKELLLIIAFIAPLFLFIWFMSAESAGVIDVSRRGMFRFDWRAAFGRTNCRTESGALPIFWVWTLYCFLPVILHWSAILLGKIGYETVGSILDNNRYTSWLYVFSTTIILLLLIGATSSAWVAMKNWWMRVAHR